MKALTPPTSIDENICSVKPPDLPSNYHDLVKLTYTRTQGRKAVSDLAQGERDVLEMARAELGWPSITSLAYKWYPVARSRKCWQRAVERCRLQKVRTRTLNLKYLLLTVLSEVNLSLLKSYSGSEALTRYLDKYRSLTTRSRYRLAQTGDLRNPRPGSYQDILLARQRELAPC